MELAFKNSAELSVGVELELQLINLKTFNLSQQAEELLQRLSHIDIPGNIKPEITRSMIEINSSVHTNFGSLLEELTTIRTVMTDIANKMQVGISGGGTHPFQKWTDRKIFPTKRFENLVVMYGYLTKLFTVFGQHIHIGCKSGDDAIKLCHGFARYIPHFIAISASSPYYQEIDSDFDCSRLNVVSAFPTSGTIPKVHSWQEFTTYYNKIMDMQIIGSMKDLYWDIRPKAEFGTVELRICDTPLQIAKSIELAAYAQALAKYLLDQPFPEDLDELYLVYSYNKFQAAKFGFAGEIIDADSKQKYFLQEDILQTLEKLQPYTKDLNIQHYLKSIKKSVSNSNNDAQLLRQIYAESNDFAKLVQKQTELWQEIAVEP